MHKPVISDTKVFFLHSNINVLHWNTPVKDCVRKSLYRYDSDHSPYSLPIYNQKLHVIYDK